MWKRILALLVTLCGLGMAMPAAVASTDAVETGVLLTPRPEVADSYLEAALTGWQQSPVYLSDQAGQLSAEDAAALAERIEGWRDDVHVAVLPAAAMSEFSGSTEPERALRFLDAAADTLDEDGIYLVSFGGVGTYGAGYGDAEGAAEVGAIVADEVGDHTLGQSDQIFNGILDQLGAPGGDGSGFPWLWAIVVVALVVLVVGLLLARMRGRAAPRVSERPSGETWGGEAEFRPSFDVQADEVSSLEQRSQLAREDVIRLGEELDAADLPVDNPAVAEHLQASLDAYAELSRRVEEQTGPEATEDQLRHIDADLEYARWRFECAKALLAGTAVPARRSACFVDPKHGLSVADVNWAPPSGSPRPIGVCRACFVRMTGGNPAADNAPSEGVQ